MLLKSAVVLSSLLFPAFAADSVPPASNLTVHEWGTFTSVANERGMPVPWAALSGSSDLPCFVYRLSAQCVKCNSTSLVRMETPVLYFYSPHPATVSVHVDLPSGLITEWYPKATGVPKGITYGNDGKIDWKQIRVLPGKRRGVSGRRQRKPLLLRAQYRLRDPPGGRRTREAALLSRRGRRRSLSGGAVSWPPASWNSAIPAATRLPPPFCSRTAPAGPVTGWFATSAPR